MKKLLCIPTLNPGDQAMSLIRSLRTQTVQPDEILIIDSGSTDGSRDLFSEYATRIHIISKNTFNHGATRQLGVAMAPDAEIIIFMTQDSLPVSVDAIKSLVACFADPKVGAVCGRQLPHLNASPIASHARLFNYVGESSTKTRDDIPRLGIKAAFISNSFAAYRRTALMDVGGFPLDVIFGEDTYVASKMLQAGWSLAYSAEASCYHSHNYGFVEEFNRYFDIGVFHTREKWFIASLGKPEGEGKKFVYSETLYLVRHAPWLIPSAIIRTGLKLLGYKLGQKEQNIPLWLKRKLSMNKGYWNGTCV